MEDFAGGDVEEQDIVGEVVGYEELVSCWIRDDGEAGGDGDGLVGGRLGHCAAVLKAAGGELLQRDGDEALRRDCSILKGVDGDGVAGLLGFSAGGGGEGVDAGVEMLAVRAEDEAGVEGLRRADECAGLGVFRELAGGGVEDGDGLGVTRFEGAVTGVDQAQVAMVGRPGHGHGQAVQRLGRAGDGLEYLLAAGEVDRRVRGLRVNGHHACGVEG